ncbi:MAG: ATP-binding cassette domain-containing protein [Nitrospirae bacterium]|uniref:energy-coupling factor ABC transporter ATP-binding protein n=1 Tax=Candidatus Magnetobacterium casense TaxID=1455061 RepID=UPI00058C6E30|nr:ATP-binding cassette domain-containing protein [Candidatus Magnetobacterium casensis]MBF0336540.1 ATP-binding cassette domain-containing protein [Nitrospirota bacterium]
MSQYILQAKDLTYTYPDGTAALRGLTVALEVGKKTAIIGPNGAGKSTFLLHLNAILKPREGKLFFKGKEFGYDRNSLRQLRKCVGVVFQDPDRQLFSASVAQDVSFGPMNLGLTVKEVTERTDWALKATGISHLKDKPVHLLSFGQKKLVTIAGVLAMQPGVIVLDEPTISLDAAHVGSLVEILDALACDGVTLVMSTHDADLAYAWADNVVVICDGTKAAEGSPAEVFSNGALLQDGVISKPFVLAVCDELRNKGFFSGMAKTPRTRNELLAAIEKKERGGL